MRKPDTFV